MGNNNQCCQGSTVKNENESDSNPDYLPAFVESDSSKPRINLRGEQELNESGGELGDSNVNKPEDAPVLDPFALHQPENSKTETLQQNEPLPIPEKTGKRRENLAEFKLERTHLLNEGEFIKLGPVKVIKSGEIYEGEWSNKKRCGFGKQIFPDESFYEVLLNSSFSFLFPTGRILQ